MARSCPHTAFSNCSRLKTTPGRLIRNSSRRNSVAVSERFSPSSFTWQLLRSSSTPPALSRRDGARLRAELQLDARDQFADEERLDDVVVRAQFEADDAVGFRSARGQEDDRRLRQLGIVADALADIQPVGIGQHDVEQDEVGADPPAKVEGATAGLRPGEKKAFFFQVVLQQREEIGIVFDENNSFCHGTFSVTGYTLQKG